MDIISESPLRERPGKAADEYRSQRHESISSDDEAVIAHETIATVPLPKRARIVTATHSPPATYITQPTQLLEPGEARLATRALTPGLIEIAASSPTRMPSPQALPSRSGGILARAMAPPGTSFRAPHGVVPKASRHSQSVEISDDEGMKYQGGSTDEESQDTRDIRPSTFIERGSKENHGFASGGGKAREKEWKDLMTRSIYKPTANASPDGSFSESFGAKHEDRTGSSKLPSFKRRAAIMDDAVGDADRGKRPRQLEPTKSAAAFPREIADISSVDWRLKTKRMMQVLPHCSIAQLYRALSRMHGDVDAAISDMTARGPRLDGIDLALSDDDDPLAGGTPSKFRAPAKQKLKAPALKIADRYTGARVAPPGITSSKAIVPKPRKRLIRGRKQATPSPDRTSPPTAQRAATPRQTLSSDSDDHSDSAIDVDAEPESEPTLATSLLGFFNTCSLDDLADIAAIKKPMAQLVVDARPFENLDQVRAVSDAAKTSNGKKTTRRPVGEKIVDVCEEMLTGYHAIDVLVQRCEALGRPLAAAMKAWGIDIHGAAKAGELELTTVQAATDGTSRPAHARDSGIGTPLSSATSDEADVEAEIKLRSVATRQAKPFFEQPGILNEVTLKDYQVVGINWLDLLFDHHLSCILADDMGLGKTLQVVAFFARLLQKNVPGPHLVIVPSSTLENWLREFQTFCPVLRVTPYYDDQKTRAELRDEVNGMDFKPDVIVTTYTTAKGKEDGKFLRRLKPCVCVFDEGHVLKNSNSIVYGELMKIPARMRLLLTGTPLQNNLTELASLLGFILPDVFTEHRHDLASIFKHKAKTTEVDESHLALLSQQRVHRARAMMAPFVLRRKKHQVLQHLPTKTRRVEYCEMSARQRELYDELRCTAKQLVDDREAGIKTAAAASTTNLMMELRKAAIHPLLFRRLYKDMTLSKMSKACLVEPENRNSNVDLVFDDFCLFTDSELHNYCVSRPKSMGKFQLKKDEWMDAGKVSVLRRLLERFAANGDRVLLFSQFRIVMDILEHVLETLDLKFFRLDGSTNTHERQSMIDEFASDTTITVFMLSTKAGGAGINLACANKVIIFDSSFNPQDDIQAENRAHRVGQTREVEVIRLVSRGTIEENIHALGETKLALDDRVAGEGELASMDANAELRGTKRVEEMLVAQLTSERTAEAQSDA